MSRSTLWALAAIVALLAFAAWRLSAEEDRDAREQEVLLFEGVDPARVVRLRVEHLGRGLHLVFERDETGRWKMTEPHAAPADSNLVGHLFQTALERRGTPVPEAEARPADLGLDPPRILLEMEEAVDGTTRRTRVEIGAIDLDGAHMSVRAGGRILETWRDLDTTLDHGLEDWMDHELVEVPPQDVVEVHRRGRIARAGESEAKDVSFDALLEDGTWRLTSPYAAALDPQGASMIVQGITLLEMKAYVDYGRRLLADFGLDPPELTLALGTVAGADFTIRFGRPEHLEGAPWYASIDGMNYVWLVEGRVVELYAAPIDEFLDHVLTRIPVSEADAASLELDGRELRMWIERKDERAKPVWMVSERKDRDSAFSPALPAEKSRVEDLLGKIARAEFASFLPGETFSEAEVRGSIVVQARDLRQGGQIGAEVAGAEGGRAVRMQRLGDSIPGLVDPALLEVLKTTPHDLWRLVVVEVFELEQRELHLARAGVSKRYVRGSKGLWTPPGIEIESKELHGVLDGLMIVRAARHLGGEEAAPLADPIEVELTSTGGATMKYTVGIAESAAEGERAQVEVEGRRAVLKDQGLHARLAAILGPG